MVMRFSVGAQQGPFSTTPYFEEPYGGEHADYVYMYTYIYLAVRLLAGRKNKVHAQPRGYQEPFSANRRDESTAG